MRRAAAAGGTRTRSLREDTATTERAVYACGCVDVARQLDVAGQRDIAGQRRSGVEVAPKCALSVPVQSRMPVRTRQAGEQVTLPVVPSSHSSPAWTIWSPQ